MIRQSGIQRKPQPFNGYPKLWLYISHCSVPLITSSNSLLALISGRCGLVLMSKDVCEIVPQRPKSALLVFFIGRAAIRYRSSDSIPENYHVTGD